MIGINFIYCRPEDEREALTLYTQYAAEGKNVMYYGGGSEIITMCTAGSIAPDVVIDLKRIPSLNVLQEDDGVISIGAACTLDRIRISGCFPLLGETGGRIADHTNQCRITLGGNLCGSIIYRETVLPLLLADAELTLFGSGGMRNGSVHDVFDGRMRLQPGELIVSACVESKFAQMPHAHMKRTFAEKIGYPAVTVAAICADGKIRAAFSGVCGYPFRSNEMERALNDMSLSRKERVNAAVSLLPEPPRTDCEGSGAYRQVLLQLMLEEAVAVLESAQSGGST